MIEMNPMIEMNRSRVEKHVCKASSEHEGRCEEEACQICQALDEENHEEEDEQGKDGQEEDEQGEERGEDEQEEEQVYRSSRKMRHQGW